MDFQLTPEDAEALRHLASVDPTEARAWLQDRPDLARRMLAWPPELRLEVSRILYLSFSEEKRAALAARRHAGSNLLELLEARDPG